MVSYPECRKGHFLRRWTEWPTWVWIYMETISAGFYHFSGCRFSKALHPSTSPKAAPQYFEDTPWPVLSKCWDWQAFFCSCCDQSMNTSSEPRYSSLSVERSSSALILQYSCSSLWLHSETQRFISAPKLTQRSWLFVPFGQSALLSYNKMHFGAFRTSLTAVTARGGSARALWTLKGFLFLPPRLPNSAGDSQ